MNLTRWTHINKEFEENSRFTKDQWCELVDSLAVPGKIINGTPFIDSARFSAAVTLNPPEKFDHLAPSDLLE